MSRVFIISAPSGSGKSTLVNRLLSEMPRLLFSVSYTTRAPRGSEQNGNEYVFISRDQFEQHIREGNLLEWAEVFGNYYGTHKEILEQARRENRDVVLDIDVQGARQLKQDKIPEAASIFILPPSQGELAKRLRARSEDSDETIRRRLAGAAKEIRDFGIYDYVVVNDDLDVAFQQLRSIVEAERLKNGPEVAARVDRILRSFEENHCQS
jgi:guanylate kinase